ncbi:MAG: cation diffusion facilitator family transporter, partial [Phycisphaerae bacterium]
MPKSAPTPEQLETQRRLRAVHLAIGVSLLVCLVELSLGWILGLASLVAEGVHTFLDGLDSVIVLIAVILAARPPDRSHQFGHGKFEALGAAVEGSFVMAAAIGIAYQSMDRLIHHQTPPVIPSYVCLIMSITAVFYFFVSMHLMRVARETQSPAVLAEALHLRTHIYIAAGIAAGLLVGALGDWPVADTLVALGVAVCLMGISLHIFRDVYKQFMDEALSAEEIKKLGSIIDRFGHRFVEVHGLRTRQAGAERHVEMHLVVMPDTPVSKAHALSHEIEAAIADAWPTTRVTVHVEPLDTARAARADWFTDQPKVRTNDASP